MPFFAANTPTLDPLQLRDPQIGAYKAVADHFRDQAALREVGLVLPVGCGKSGLIAILPFAVHAQRTLVVAPNLRLRGQLADDLDPSKPRENFLHKRGIVPLDVGWERVVLASNEANIDDLTHADVVVTNIHQLAREQNRWLDAVDDDFFDLIVVDEAHHNVATSWTRLLEKFPASRVVNLSATPRRADGRAMSGRIIYSYSLADAMDREYVRKLRSVRLNPRTLTFTEQQHGVTVEIPLAEVVQLGDSDAQFRRQIVMSDESLGSIVNAAILRLADIRERTGDRRYKIVASALNYTHCLQVVEAFRARDMRTDYVHNVQGEEENDRVFAELEAHEIDVIVQVRMLGEGFNHPFLAVAAVCSVFGSLTPFLQFVGRVLRTIPGEGDFQAVVVAHAGSNVARLWEDLRLYSDADQEFFNALLPFEDAEIFGNDAEHETVPGTPRAEHTARVVAQGVVELAEETLIENPAIAAALATLEEQNVEPQVLQTLFVQRQQRRRAARERLHDAIPIVARRELGRHGIDPGRMSPKPPDNNLLFVIKATNVALAEAVGRPVGGRDEWPLEALSAAQDVLDACVEGIVAEAYRAG